MLFVKICLLSNLFFRKTSFEKYGGISLNNLKIRQQLLLNGIKHYELAEAIGIYPTTLSVWLRTEFNNERLERVEKALEQLIKNK